MSVSISRTVRYFLSSIVAIILFALSLQAQSTGNFARKSG